MTEEGTFLRTSERCQDVIGNLQQVQPKDETESRKTSLKCTHVLNRIIAAKEDGKRSSVRESGSRSASGSVDTIDVDSKIINRTENRGQLLDITSAFDDLLSEFAEEKPKTESDFDLSRLLEDIVTVRTFDSSGGSDSVSTGSDSCKKVSREATGLERNSETKRDRENSTEHKTLVDLGPIGEHYTRQLTIKHADNSDTHIDADVNTRSVIQNALMNDGKVVRLNICTGLNERGSSAPSKSILSRLKKSKRGSDLGSDLHNLSRDKYSEFSDIRRVDSVTDSSDLHWQCSRLWSDKVDESSHVAPITSPLCKGKKTSAVLEKVAELNSPSLQCKTLKNEVKMLTSKHVNSGRTSLLHSKPLRNERCPGITKEKWSLSKGTTVTNKMKRVLTSADQSFDARLVCGGQAVQLPIQKFICAEKDVLAAEVTSVHEKEQSMNFYSFASELDPSFVYGKDGGKLCVGIQSQLGMLPNSLVLHEKCFLVNLFIEGQYMHVGPLLLEVYEKMTVEMLKIKVCKEFQIDPSIQRWILGSSVASGDSLTLGSFGILPNSCIFLYLELDEEDSRFIITHLSTRLQYSGSGINSGTYSLKSDAAHDHISALKALENRATCERSCHSEHTRSYRSSSDGCVQVPCVSDSRESASHVKGRAVSFSTVADAHRKRILPKFKLFEHDAQFCAGSSQRDESPEKALKAMKLSRRLKILKERANSADIRRSVMQDHFADSCSSGNSSTGYVTVSSSSSVTSENPESCHFDSCSKVMTDLQFDASMFSIHHAEERMILKQEESCEEVQDFCEDHVDVQTSTCLVTEHHSDVAVAVCNIHDIDPSSDEKVVEYHSEKERPSYGMLLELEALNVVPNAEPFECPVCFLDVGAGDGVILRDCLHMFCKDCLSSTIVYATESLVKCPYRDDLYSCVSVLQQREIKALVSPEVYEQYLQRSLSAAESVAEKSFHCKTVDCPGWCLYEDNVNIFHCPVCSHYNCLTCQAIHEGLNCRQYQDKLKAEAEIDEAAEKTLNFLQKMVDEGKAMKCPKCSVVLMKKWGCDWLKCSVCGTEVCWITKGPRWGPDGHGDTSAGCRCGVDGKKCHPSCTYCH